MDEMNIDIHREIYLVPWKKEWAHIFHMEKQNILAVLAASEHTADVRHVGSTSVRDMVAKPLIDILICPDRDIPLEAIIADLERIGYKNLGDGGRTGRYFLSRGDKPNETFYVHLCYEDHQVAKDQLTFKWIEGTNLTVRRKYKRLKILLADAFPDDREMYRELKGLFIEGVLSAYRQAAGEDFEEG